jgi:biotin carboxylase
MSAAHAQIFALGSQRQASELATEIQLPVTNVSDSDDGVHPRASIDIAEEIVAKIDSSSIAGICPGRGTVAGGIASIADGWRRAANRRENLSSVWIGPNFLDASVFEDKLTGADRMVEAGLPVVPYCAQARQVAAYPAVLKDRRGTGGSGMRLINDDAEARAGERLFSADGRLPIFNALRRGVETSLEAIVLPSGHVLPIAAVVKEECDQRLIHADWKLKLALPLDSYQPGRRLLDRFVAAFPDIRGYISIEVIADGVADPEVIEVATRRTGNYPLSMAVSGATVSRALAAALQSRPAPRDFNTSTPGTAVGIALAISEPSFNGRPDLDLLPRPLMIAVDDLGALPGAEKTGAPARVRLGYRTSTYGRFEVDTVGRVLHNPLLAERLRRLIAAASASGFLIPDRT